MSAAGLYTVPTGAILARLEQIRREQAALERQAVKLAARLALRGVDPPPPDWLVQAHQARLFMDAAGLNHVRHPSGRRKSPTILRRSS